VGAVSLLEDAVGRVDYCGGFGELDHLSNPQPRAGSSDFDPAWNNRGLMVVAAPWPWLFIDPERVS